jgi:hypothetical protein
MDDMTVENWKLVDDCQHAQFYYKRRGDPDMIACVVIPHSGNGNKWLLRIGFSSTFNKWNDAECEGKFDSLDELKAFMEDEGKLKAIEKADF